MHLSLKEYSDGVGISYEAARSSFNRHKGKELIEGQHYLTVGRSRILTQEGIDQMNSFRKQPEKQQLMISPADIERLNERIKALESDLLNESAKVTALEQEKADLMAQLTALKDQLDHSKDEALDLFRELRLTQQKLSTTSVSPEEPEQQKRGFFSRLFKR